MKRILLSALFGFLFTGSIATANQFTEGLRELCLRLLTESSVALSDARTREILRELTDGFSPTSQSLSKRPILVADARSRVRRLFDMATDGMVGLEERANQVVRARLVRLQSDLDGDRTANLALLSGTSRILTGLRNQWCKACLDTGNDEGHVENSCLAGLAGFLSGALAVVTLTPPRTVADIAARVAFSSAVGFGAGASYYFGFRRPIKDFLATVTRSLNTGDESTLAYLGGSYLLEDGVSRSDADVFFAWIRSNDGESFVPILIAHLNKPLN